MKLILFLYRQFFDEYLKFKNILNYKKLRYIHYNVPYKLHIAVFILDNKTRAY